MKEVMMLKFFRPFILLAFIVPLFSCISLTPPPSATTTGPRTLVLNGKTITETDAGGFTSWYCTDYVYEEKGILLEVGYFNDPKFNGLGFVLYDGGYTGELAQFQRNGVEQRWDWGSNSQYSFVLKADGTGLYYDFSNVPTGESTKASEVFKCYKR
jgi:hypothetical protein